MTRRALFMIAAWVIASPSAASQLLVSGTSARDTALAGSTVAQPRTPSAAMFANPAGLVLFDEMTVDGNAAFAWANPRVDVSAPSTYDETSSVMVMSPAMGVAVPSKGSWHFGVGLYGSVGNKFDFGADPSEGVPDDFLSEAGVFTLGAGVAYRFGDRLSVGAAVTPLFGLLHNRYTLGGLRFKYRLNGPGIQGMLGLRWEPRPGLALGLGVRTPGRVWLEGDTPLAGSRQDVDLELKMPTQVFAGVSKHFGERVIVSLAGRWTDSSSFGDSTIEFEVTEAADAPFVPHAKDEWLVSAGLEYLWSELLTLRLGVGHSNAIVGDKGVSPLCFDTQDTRVAVGFSLNLDPWSVDFMAGHAFRGSRDIGADEALILPGRYSIDGQVAMIGITWRH